ncbi:YgaB family protein [Bacillus safensis]|uniref:YgaB family protein n=1 Tax=Bacillus TaxID=1386 RepID=UPI002DBABD54|nr:YgaB family protein [Bacillus safensis]MEC0986246.1 YgaB family protein [Bacillus safensis]
MSDFDQLVKEQMQLMDQLLDVQGELDLCLETEKQLQQDEKKEEWHRLCDQIKQKREELQKCKPYLQNRQKRSSTHINRWKRVLA